MTSQLKNKRLHQRLKTESGIILLVVLWVLTILAVLTVSLGRTTHMELAMVRYEVGKVQSKFLAWAGVHYSMGQIFLDSQDSESAQFDTLRYCGVPANDQVSLDEWFRNKKLKKGEFNIEYDVHVPETGNVSSVAGIQDMDRFININAISQQNSDTLKSLIELLGFDVEIAGTIATSVVDWIDEDSNLSDDIYGAEDDHYMSLDRSYHCKNHPFDSKEELLLVRGMNQEIYDKLKHYVTIFPREGSLRINFDTAPKEVLQAVARSVSGPMTQTDHAQADSMAEKLIEYRAGEDGIESTDDDRQIDLNEIALTQPEKVLFLVINAFRTKKSEYFRITSKGVEDTRGIATTIDAVIERSDLNIVSWRRK